MASTTFVDGQTLIEASWLNDVNDAVYNPAAAIIPASSIVNTPAGNIAATTVQDALNELDSEKQPLDTELTALSTATAAADKIPYFTSTTTASTLTRSIDGTLAGNSDTNIPTEKAVKTYADTKDISTQVAPGTSGNVLTSNGSAWTSEAPSPIGLGYGQTWQSGFTGGTHYHNTTGKPIFVSCWSGASGGSSIQASATDSGYVTIAYDSSGGAGGVSSGCSAIIPVDWWWIATNTIMVLQ